MVSTLTMHILFLTDNFPPEGNAPATRTFEHVREWVNTGHKVTVITCAPNFPEGRVFEGYKNKWLLREKIEGINIWRVKTYITANDGFIKRTIDFISFMFSSFLFGLFVKNVQVVIGTSPQFFTIISAWALGKCKRVPFVFELRDLWPASISAVGIINSPLIIYILEKLEVFLYHQASLIIFVTQSFKFELQNKGVPTEKIVVLPNGVDLAKYKPLLSKDAEFSKKYHLKDKFVAGYIGTHGLAHGLDTIIQTAELLKDDNDIRIVFAGGGADRNRLEELVKADRLQNVVMIQRQPKELMQKLWSVCDVSLVTLKNKSLFSTVVPSKIYESMAMKLPIIISVPEGEATKIIRSKNCGLIVAPENPIDLAQAVKKLKEDKALYQALSANSVLAAQRYDRKYLANEMLSYLKDRVT